MVEKCPQFLIRAPVRNLAFRLTTWESKDKCRLSVHCSGTRTTVTCISQPFGFSQAEPRRKTRTRRHASGVQTRKYGRRKRRLPRGTYRIILLFFRQLHFVQKHREGFWAHMCKHEQAKTVHRYVSGQRGKCTMRQLHANCYTMGRQVVPAARQQV